MRHGYEVPDSAVLDWPERRNEVNAKRAGIMTSNLGGYYAPRTASMEKHFKVCVAGGLSEITMLFGNGEVKRSLKLSFHHLVIILRGALM